MRSLNQYAPRLNSRAMTRKKAAPLGPPTRAPITTSKPPSPAIRSVVRSAALKLERLVVVISVDLLWGWNEACGEYTDPPQWAISGLSPIETVTFCYFPKP